MVDIKPLPRRRQDVGQGKLRNTLIVEGDMQVPFSGSEITGTNAGRGNTTVITPDEKPKARSWNS